MICIKGVFMSCTDSAIALVHSAWDEFYNQLAHAHKNNLRTRSADLPWPRPMPQTPGHAQIFFSIRYIHVRLANLALVLLRGLLQINMTWLPLDPTTLCVGVLIVTLCCLWAYVAVIRGSTKLPDFTLLREVSQKSVNSQPGSKKSPKSKGRRKQACKQSYYGGD